MAEAKPRPTAEELEELVELVRRDPASPAFVDLGEAYLALGRPREALEVGGEGLRHTPDNHEGRLMVAKSHAALHQWKEAQAELLRIVKVDRTNRVGFTLLGEVLMRRADYERAVPVLQHAQNLDPGSPQVLNLLRLARGGMQLEPPPPIPTPVAPRRSEARPARAPAPPPIAPPTPAALPQRSQPRTQPPGPPPRSPARASAPPPIAPPPPVATRRMPEPDSIDDGPTKVGGGHAGMRTVTAEETAVRDDPTMPSQPPDVGWYDGPPTTPATPAAQRMPIPAAPTPVRPRVLPQAKPVNAAAASLRQSAAVGENYLNDLLTGGLLDVPGVRVPDSDYDVRPDKRWGHSSIGAFIFLFVLLIGGIAGGGYWWWHSEQEKNEFVTTHRQLARDAMAPGTFDGLTKSLDELTKALKRDDKNTRTFAAVAESAALRALLYGTSDDGVDEAIKGAARDIDKPQKKGFHDLLVARAAIALARFDGSEGTLDSVNRARMEMAAWLKDHPDDRWVQWLAARGLLATGHRSDAITGFQQAGDASDGLVLAQIDRADLLADDGKFDDAMKLYDAVLQKVPHHPLAVLGRSLARAERGNGTPAAMDDLNVELDKDLGKRTAAYRQLALAMAYYQLEDYVRMNEALGKAEGPHEPRFVARVALGRILQGRHDDAVKILGDILAYYGKIKPDPDPLVTVVNGALKMAGGTPEAALDILAHTDGTRARVLRGQALIDQGKYKDALDELTQAKTDSPELIEVEIWSEVAATLTETGKARSAAAAELEKTSRRAKSKVGRYAHGLTMLLTGDLKEARRRLEQALDSITDDAPNPLAYRTRVALASVERQEGNLDAAISQLEESLKLNSGYLPARIELAKVAVAREDGDAAALILDPVMQEKELVTWQVALLDAEALARRSLDGKKDKEKKAMREAAIAQLSKAKDAGAPPEELARVAMLIDPALIESMGLPEPPEAEDDKGKGKGHGR